MEKNLAFSSYEKVLIDNPLPNGVNEHGNTFNYFGLSVALDSTGDILTRIYIIIKLHIQI